MEIVTKVMEKSWKSHGNLLVKMCTNPDCIYYSIFTFLFSVRLDNIQWFSVQIRHLGWFSKKVSCPVTRQFKWVIKKPQLSGLFTNWAALCAHLKIFNHSTADLSVKRGHFWIAAQESLKLLDKLYLAYIFHCLVFVFSTKLEFLQISISSVHWIIACGTTFMLCWWINKLVTCTPDKASNN